MFRGSAGPAQIVPLTPTRRGRSCTRFALVQPIPTLPGMAALVTRSKAARNRSAYG